MRPSLRVGIGALTVFVAGVVHAHAPVVEHKDATVEKPIRITWSLDTSIAIYAHFENKNDVDVVAFQVDAKKAATGQKLYVHTLVPACGVYTDLLPAVAVVGPGLPLPSSENVDVLPFSIPPGEGAHVLRNTRQGNTWYEPYSKKNYYWQGSITILLTDAGKYLVYTWSPDKRVGDYVLAIGTRERWGPREIARAVRHMPRLLSHREIHSQACREELKYQEPSKNPLPSDIHGK